MENEEGFNRSDLDYIQLENWNKSELKYLKELYSSFFVKKIKTKII